MARRVIVENPADGGFFYWLFKLYAFSAIGLAALGAGGLVALYVQLAAGLPEIRSLAAFRRRLPLTTRVRAWDGQTLGEFARERRDVRDLETMPPLLLRAFLAAEDRRFYAHEGLDLRGIARAAWTNLRAGSVLQGGSTITQQVAKALLGPERTIARKMREAILAHRLEARFTKRQILYFYLNTIFFGHGTYGVAAAAERFFGKDLGALSLDEMALLAGIVRAPARYSPVAHAERARARRDLVLDLMAKERMIDEKTRDEARARPLRVAGSPRDFYRERAPYFTERVRRLVAKRHGERALYEGGLVVETSADLVLDALARANVDFALRKLDKRQGWRGPEARLRTAEAREAFLTRALAEYPDGVVEEERPYLALVESASARAARVRIGPTSAALPRSRLAWASRYDSANATNDRPADSVDAVLSPGDVVWVTLEGRAPAAAAMPTVALEQTPRLQAALYTFDHRTGYVLAHVGGHDFDRSSFDRVTQACRQPGSTFKPIYYSLALDGDASMATVLHDKPYVPEPGEEWSPRNIHGTLDGQVTLWAALVRSLNLPSIQVLVRVGPEHAAEWSRRLGITTPLHADRALALGASCTHLDELARAFAIFARGGTWVDPTPIRRVLDRNGRVLEDHTVPADPWLDAASRLDRVAALLGERSARVIDARTAHMTSRLLRDDVAYGIAARAGTIGGPAAGKGGTSSDTMDVSFVGYTSQWLTAAWVGDDTYERPLGSDDASYTIAIPMWARYMKDAVGERPLEDIPWQPRPAGLVTISVDPATGLPAPSGGFTETGFVGGVRMVMRAADAAKVAARTTVE
ncbi:MAG: PBP1A family penicillin-binding protein [Myxococcota bacterium]